MPSQNDKFLVQSLAFVLFFLDNLIEEKNANKDVEHREGEHNRRNNDSLWKMSLYQVAL